MSAARITASHVPEAAITPYHGLDGAAPHDDPAGERWEHITIGHLATIRGRARNAHWDQLTEQARSLNAG